MTIYIAGISLQDQELTNEKALEPNTSLLDSQYLRNAQLPTPGPDELALFAIPTVDDISSDNDDFQDSLNTPEEASANNIGNIALRAQEISTSLSTANIISGSQKRKPTRSAYSTQPNQSSSLQYYIQFLPYISRKASTSFNSTSRTNSLA
ncbi:hypothetical protein ACMFMF_008547 [Clarireedia jacksonii]